MQKSGLIKEVRKLRSHARQVESRLRHQSLDSHAHDDRMTHWFVDCPLPYQSLDRTGHLLAVNPAWLRVLGYTRDQVMGRWFGDFLAEPSRRVFQERFPRFLQAGEIHASCLELVCAQGSTLWAEFEGRVAINPDGTFRKTHCVFQDITERKQVEESLCESEERYRLLFTNMRNGFALHEIVMNEQGEPIDYMFLEVNSAFEQLTGLRRSDIIGRRVTYAIPSIEKESPGLIGQFGRVVRTGQAMRFEQFARVLNKWFSVLAFRPREGQFATIFEDITERRRVEALLQQDHNELEQRVQERTAELSLTNEALGQSREHLRITMSQIPGMMWTTDTELTFTLSLGAGLPILGLTPGQIVGMSLFEFFNTDDPDHRSIAMHRRALQGESVTFDDERDGVHFQTSLEPLRHSEGDIIGVIGTAYDVTERHCAEEALKASETMFRTMINGSRDGILIACAKTKRLLLVNPSMATMCGYAQDEMAGLSVHDIFSINVLPTTFDEYDSMVCTDRNVITDMQVLRKDGAIFYADTSVSPIHLDARKCLMFFLRDVTERRRIQEELQQHRMEIAHASRLDTVGQMAASFAHELNQPLCGVMMHAEGCLRTLRHESVDKDKITKKLETITHQCEYAGQVIARLRAFIEKGQRVRERVSVNVIVSEALRFMEAECRRHDTQVIWEPKEDVYLVTIDPVQIEQVLLNLIQNGLDAMHGMPVHQRSLLIRCRMKGRYVAVSIRDVGTGIAEENRELVFDSFFTTKVKGLGIGLSVSRSIVESHGGQLRVTANDTQGVTFTLTLPVVGTQGGTMGKATLSGHKSAGGDA